MRILLVSSYLPFPLHSGGHIRLYNLLKQLSKYHKITLICEKRDYQTKKDIDEVKKFCEEVVVIPRKPQWSIENIVKSGISTYPFLLTGHTLSEMKKRIVAILQEKRFDCIHVETFYVFQNVPKTYLPVVLVEHNIEYFVYKRYVTTRNRFMRVALMADVLKIKVWEERFWKKADALVAVSEEEKKTMEKVKSDVFVVPNGVDVKKFKGSNVKLKGLKKGRRILFIGDFKWIQNRKAAESILRDIWPLIRTQMTEDRRQIKLWIVGKNIPENLKNLARGDDSIYFDENASDDTVKIYQKAEILLAPILVGGGTSYKILEAMSCGVPVVTTPLGVSGLGAKHNQEVLVGTTGEELAAHVVTLLDKPVLDERIAKAARQFVEKNYTWESIAEKLENVYKTVTEQL